jgi:hypothetical protein
MYTIYHVVDEKCGCTQNFPQRCYDQGFKNGEFEVIEIWPDAVGDQFASDREQYWNGNFGYSRSMMPYTASISGSKRGAAATIKKYGTLGFGLSSSSKQRVLGIRSGKKIHTCPHCGLVGQGPAMNRWHFNNCHRR